MPICRSDPKIKERQSKWTRQTGKQIERENILFDTETTFGAATLIADSNGRYTDTFEFKDTSGLLKWLSNPKYKNYNLFFFNLQYDVNAIVKWLSVNDRRVLVYTGKLIYGNYRLTMIENKEFTVARIRPGSVDEKHPYGVTRNTNRYYDCMQYLPVGSLAELSKNTPYPKMEFDIGTGLDLQRYLTDEQYHNDVIKYCIHDCLAAKHLTDKVIELIYSLDIKPRTWHSKASLAKNYCLRRLPVAKLKTPYKGVRIRQDALMAVRGAMIECHSLGVFKNVKAPDVRSCYPSFIAELPDYSGIVKYGKSYEPDSSYSWYHVVIDFEHPYASMLWYPQVNPVTMKPITEHWHPTGKTDVWLCKPEFEYFYERGYLTEDNIIYASHVMPSSKSFKPFYNIVHDLYNARRAAIDDGNPIEKVLKIVSNSIYGLMLNSWADPIYITYEEINELKNTFLEMYMEDNKHTLGAIKVRNPKTDNGMVVKLDLQRAGSMYAPFMASHTLASARVKLFTDLEKDINKGHVLAFATDAVFLSKMYSKIAVSDKLGDWDLKTHEKVLQYGTGRRVIEKDGKILEKESMSRGIPFKSEIIVDLLNKHSLDSFIPMTRDKVIKLKTSLRSREREDTFNTFRPMQINLQFKTDKRHWFDRYKTVGEIFDRNITSRPFTLDELK